MNVSEFLQRERFFIWALAGLLFLLFLTVTGPGMKGEGSASSPAPYFSAAEVIPAIRSGRVSPLVIELLCLLSVVSLTFFVTGVTLNLSGWLRKNWRMFSPGETPRVEWGVWPVVKIFVYFYFWILLFQILGGAVVEFIGLSRARLYALSLVSNAFFQYGLIIVLVYGYLKKSGYSPSALRLKFTRWFFCFRQALRGYVVFFPFFIILSVASIVLTQALGLHFKSHPLVGPLLEKGQPAYVGILFCLAVFFAPVVEEIFFRGFLYPAMKRRVSVPWAIFISAALFSTLHLTWSGWLPILGLGMLLAYSYEKTGSLLVPIFIHSVHNALFLTYAALSYRILGNV